MTHQEVLETMLCYVEILSKKLPCCFSCKRAQFCKEITDVTYKHLSKQKPIDFTTGKQLKTL